MPASPLVEYARRCALASGVMPPEPDPRREGWWIGECPLCRSQTLRIDPTGEPGCVGDCERDRLHDELLRADRSATGQATRWLRESLSDGPVPAEEVRQRANAAGVASRTLDRAKAVLEVKSAKVGTRWEWSLPGVLHAWRTSSKYASVNTASGEVAA